MVVIRLAIFLVSLECAYTRRPGPPPALWALQPRPGLLPPRPSSSATPASAFQRRHTVRTLVLTPLSQELTCVGTF